MNRPALQEIRPRPRPVESAGPKVSSGSSYLNRELSWLEFNRRVLAEAADPDVPLLERLKFVAIFESNLDEFFMKRVGGLKQQVASNTRAQSPDGLTPRRQLTAIDRMVRPLLVEERHLLTAELLPALARIGVEILPWAELSAAERRFARDYFRRHVFPILTPLAVDPAHPFPFISNLSQSLAVGVRSRGASRTHFARVKVPASLQRWVALPRRHRFVALEDLVVHHVEELFPGLEVIEAWPFRVTRNADVERSEETADDLLEAIQEELAKRRFATVVRLEVDPRMPRWMRALMRQQLDFAEEDVYEIEPPLALRDLAQLAQLPLHDHRFPEWNPPTHPRLAAPAPGEEVDLFATIAAGDLLLHHPYDSFATSVQRLIGAAAQDPSVLAIKQTLYRTSTGSPLMKSLIRAAEEDKQVAVSVEIKARFDEANNIEWGEALEKAGAHVSYGHVGLKNHAKVTLVVREEGGRLVTYSHLGTGNYNADTARLYTDLGLLTADPVIGADVVKLFNLLTGYLHRPHFEKLLVAPINMKQRFLELIEREIGHQRAGAGGYLLAKMNGLEDVDIVDALYAASAAGVEIDLIVRGVCRLRPGLPGRSETIRVRSIVGRFLEHARIFYFHNGGAGEYYMGSADWMRRNLEFRVEAVVPVEDPALQGELRELLDAELADNLKAWELTADGTWYRRSSRPGAPPSSCQARFMERALERSRRPPVAAE
jgi:polyphosphate kinase